MTRVAAILGIVALCFVGAALAQTDIVPAGPFVAEFTQHPEGRHYAANYPNEALARNVQGAVVLCCRPNADLSLDCAYAFEWPNGSRFGDASVRVARQFRVTQGSHDSFYATPHNWMRQTMVWSLAAEPTEQLDQARRLIREEGAGLCRPDPMYATTIELPPEPSQPQN